MSERETAKRLSALEADAAAGGAASTAQSPLLAEEDLEEEEEEEEEVGEQKDSSCSASVQWMAEVDAALGWATSAAAAAGVAVEGKVMALARAYIHMQPAWQVNDDADDDDLYGALPL